MRNPQASQVVAMVSRCVDFMQENLRIWRKPHNRNQQGASSRPKRSFSRTRWSNPRNGSFIFHEVRRSGACKQQQWIATGY